MKIIENTNYAVSQEGEVFNTKTQKYLKGSKDKDGYLRFRLGSKNVSFHRMVMETFSPREDMTFLEVNHINGNKMDNRLENLEWSSKKDNMTHMVQTGLSKNCSHKGESNPRAKVGKKEVLAMRKEYDRKRKTVSQLSKDFNLGWTTVSDIVKRKSWKHLE